MASSSCSASSTTSLLGLLLLFLIVTVETRPSLKAGDKQVLNTLFGSHLASLILTPPTSDDITEGSAGRPGVNPSSSSSSSTGLAGRREAVPRFFLDFLQRRSKMKRRSRTSMVGGRGCFGMKMDRIGSISGLGC